jgi:ubiquinone biosynthesis protein
MPGGTRVLILCDSIPRLRPGAALSVHARERSLPGIYMIETVVLHRRHRGRYQHIVRVLLSHGLGGLIEPFDPRGRRRQQDQNPIQNERSSRIRAVHLRRAFEELGPTFVKLGQILSTRVDLLPPVYIEELEKLQDDVPPADADAIAALVERELNAPIGELFATFERDPIASASIGQVHAATLLDGRSVVVKVQRPGVQRIIHQDLSILADVARIGENRSDMLRRQRVSEVVHEFSWTLRTELDYLHEARTMERFARAFADAPSLQIPAVLSQMSTSRVLTMERVDGLPIDNVAAIEAAGHDPTQLVNGVILMLARGILDIGLFHADPHPGNFSVDADGALVVYDFGMVGSIDDRLREKLLLLIVAVADRDAQRIVDEVAQLGVVESGWDRKAMERDVAHLVAQYVGVPLSQLPLVMIINDVMNMLRRYELRLPPELSLLAKTATMAESLARSLDPEMNVFDVVRPIIKRSMDQFYSLDYWKNRLKYRPLEIALLGASLPGYLQRIFTRIDANDLAFHVEVNDLDRTMGTLERLVNRLSLAILAAAGFIAVGMVYVALQPALISWQGAVMIALMIPLLFFTFTVVLGIRRSGR